MSKTVIQQYNYHQWANNRFFEHLKSLPDEVYEKEVQSIFASVSEVIVHIYQVDAMWLSVMAGDPFEQTMNKVKQFNERSANKSLNQMEELYADLAEQYTKFLKELEVPNEIMTIEHPTYGSLETSVTALVDHVVNHGTYHRGNITAMLRQQGHAGVPTDYVFYLYKIA